MRRQEYASSAHPGRHRRAVEVEGYRVLPLHKVNEFAGVPFTVKSLA